MTYFGVLLSYIVPALAVLLILVPRDVWSWLAGRSQRVDWAPYRLALVHVGLALVYTTPWDNYLVATGVWRYDPHLVAGIVLGWVPLEEYLFFVLQTLLTALWTVALIRTALLQTEVVARSALRRAAAVIVVAIWMEAAALTLVGWAAGTYLTLILVWALVPLFIQMAFGADILFAYGRRLLPAIAAPTFYLWAVDALAIGSGTWTLDPGQTTGLTIGILPIEEMLFFLMTNLIIAFGMTLMLAPESQRRAGLLVRSWRAMRRRPNNHSASV
ncbi:MAG: lycopene cyclase domain-containing protein [Anaerolineae bacterium]